MTNNIVKIDLVNPIGVPSPANKTTNNVILHHRLPAGVPLKKFQMIEDAIEIPEMLYVQTCFITEETANVKKLQTYSLLSPGPRQAPPPLQVSVPVQPPRRSSTLHQNQTEIIVNTTPFIPIRLPPKKTFISMGVQTEDSRDKTQPTHVYQISKRSIGIQCKLKRSTEVTTKKFKETSTIDNLWEYPRSANTPPPANEEEFMHFVAKYSHCYSNGRHECLKCGEIAYGTDELHAHMKRHCPVRLCFVCGLQMTKADAKRHRCDNATLSSKNPKKLRNRFPCPHFKCPARAVSKLELYDHINEHSLNWPYHCAGCKRKFKTAIELRRHSLMRLKCLQSRNLKFPYRLNKSEERVCRMRLSMVVSLRKGRALFKNILPNRADARRSMRCTVCMKKCTNTFQYRNHLKRCLTSYKKRLERKYHNLNAAQ